MRYILMLYADQKVGVQIPPEQMAKVMQTMGAYEQALTKAGALVLTSPLARVENARTLRMHGGEIVRREGDKEKYFVTEGGELRVHDGPYADTREQLGGFYIIEAGSMDEALEWASKCPAAQWGPVEVREMRADF